MKLFRGQMCSAFFSICHAPLDPGGIVNLFIVVCLLWTTVRVPAVLARMAARGGTRTPGAYLIRAVLMQQLARSVRRLALHP